MDIYFYLSDACVVTIENIVEVTELTNRREHISLMKNVGFFFPS